MPAYPRREILVQSWSDDEIALRWLGLYPPRDPMTGRAAAPEERHVKMITSDPKQIAKLRDRLASLSWFMRCLNEPIARAANREHDCTGRFWEGRFKSQTLLDEAAILACSVYVDLNPIRAGAAETPEESEFTSGFDRIQSWTGRQLRAKSRGTIPGALSPILQRLGLNGNAWIETVQHFGRLFKRAVGRVDSLTAAAAHSGRRWFQGRSAARIAFE